jgi:hypothetical protein
MITFFTIPKPFKDHISIIQRNAILSWQQLHADCEIILYGDEEGIRGIADEYGLIHIPDIKKNEYGTPFLDFVFKDAQSRAKNDILCYANADIIFLKDFITSIQSIKKDPFLAIGERWDIDIIDPLCFSDDNWENNVRTMVKNQGNRLGPWAIDYFAFSKTAPLQVLPFLVGREGWDNWMIYHATKAGIPVVDITRTSTVIHQNHDYNHVPLKKGGRWKGPESDYNLNLTGSKIVQKAQVCKWRIDETEYILTSEGLLTRQKRIYDKMLKKIILASPDFLLPVIGLFILKIGRRMERIRNKF